MHLDPSDTPERPHAYSRYMCVTEGLIDALQQDYLAGRPVGQSAPAIDPTLAAIIVAESLEADHEWDTFPQRIAGTAPPRPGSAPTSDWTRAALAELFFEAADLARSTGNTARYGDMWALAWACLDELLKTPTASPMLWYEDIFFDVGQQLRQLGDREAIDYLQRGLAHNLYHDEGNNADNFLRDLAETYLILDDLDRGLAMLAALLRNDPGDIWTYNLMAITFERFGLAELGAQAAQRGLALIKERGDPEELHDQLQTALEELQSSKRRGRERKVKPQVLAELRAALDLDFDAGQGRPIAELCRELVPNLDRLPVKRPRDKPDLPPPGEWARRLEETPPGRKPGRNDPCWCGSGKKYKHCHLRSDQGRKRS